MSAVTESSVLNAGLSSAIAEVRPAWLHMRNYATMANALRIPVRDVRCDRCGCEADANRVDVTSLGDAEPRIVWGRIVCTTPGCVDEHGSSAVDPPDEPGQLTREDRKWLRRHDRLVAELGRASRLLLAES